MVCWHELLMLTHQARRRRRKAARKDKLERVIQACSCAGIPVSLQVNVMTCELSASGLRRNNGLLTLLIDGYCAKMLAGSL